MKKKTAIALTLLCALSALAGWIPQPLDVALPSTNCLLSVAATGTVTDVAAPASGTQRLGLTWSCGQIKPGGPDETVTVAVDGTEYVFTNGSPAQASADGWIGDAAVITVTLAASVTNLPAVRLAYIPSPLTVTRALLPHERWRCWGARPASPILPAATSNAIAVSASYAYAAGPGALYSLTNGAAPALETAALRFLPADTLTVTGARVTNSPVIRLELERFFLREPAELPPLTE